VKKEWLRICISNFPGEAGVAQWRTHFKEALGWVSSTKNKKKKRKKKPWPRKEKCYHSNI
jgi:hypothetical protein